MTLASDWLTAHLVARPVEVQQRGDHQQITHVEAGGRGVKPGVDDAGLRRLEEGN